MLLSGSAFFPTGLAKSGQSWLATSRGAVWRSDDGGQSWQELIDFLPHDTGGASDVAVIDGRIFAPTASGLMWTEDDGNTWHNMGQPTSSGIEISNGRVYLEARSGVASAPLPR